MGAIPLLISLVKMKVSYPLSYSNFKSILSMLVDAHIDNPSDLKGASRTVGGLLCGKAHGNVFNVGDAKEGMESDIGLMKGKIKVFRLGDDPSSQKPQMTVKVKVKGNLAPVLTEFSKLYSPVKSKQFILFL